MNKPTDWSLIARHLSGECSPAETDRVEAWMTSAPENQRLMELMKVAWDVPESQAESSDVKVLWNAVAQKAGIAAIPQEVKVRARPARVIEWPFGIRLAPRLAYAWAAVLLLCMVSIAYLLSKGMNTSPWSHGLKRIMVERGERTSLTLSDGTRIVLDAGSTLEYPRRFTGDEREVFLNGEGYFDVPPQMDRPFVIHANHATVRVLGTKFNVRAWQPDRRVTVAVAEGDVSLRPAQGTVRQEVVISKGQSSILEEYGQPSQPIPVDVEKHLAWMDNEVAFEDAPLREILYQLERWYDLRFVLDDPAIGDEHLTIHIQETSIDDILELIAVLTGLDFSRTGQTVHFKAK